MNPFLKTLLATTALTGVMTANAHVSFNADNELGTKAAYAGKTYYATLNIPHGCENLEGTAYDTIKVEIELPAGITSVRPANASFGEASVEKDENDNVTKLIWTKSTEAAANDDFLYQVSFKGVLPATALTTLVFPTTQTCAGDTIQEWEGVDAPKLLVLPARKAGWNKYTAQSDISLDTVKSFFGDALIVWSGDKAWSSNTVTNTLIKNPLENIPASIPTGAEYWVKY